MVVCRGGRHHSARFLSLKCSPVMRRNCLNRRPRYFACTPRVRSTTSTSSRMIHNGLRYICSRISATLSSCCYAGRGGCGRCSVSKSRRGSHIHTCASRPMATTLTWRGRARVTCYLLYRWTQVNGVQLRRTSHPCHSHHGNASRLTILMLSGTSLRCQRYARRGARRTGPSGYARSSRRFALRMTRPRVQSRRAPPSRLQRQARARHLVHPQC